MLHHALRCSLCITACLYGDRRLECPILVTDTTEQCTSEQEASCCETCFELTVTTPATTVNPCQDTVSDPRYFSMSS